MPGKAPGKTPIMLAMGYFGRTPGQTLHEFKAEFDALSAQDKQDIATGLTPGESGEPSYSY